MPEFSAMCATPTRPPLRVVLCAPRGFCAGVVRAIDVVERALQIYGPPVYVRHEIVHNKFVVDSLKAKGAVFIEELEEAPPGAHPVIFSAHGVAKAVLEEAGTRNLLTIDATCPLVTKVHREAQAHFKRGRRIVFIGHAGHPEVIGTMGQLPPGAVTLVSSIEEVEALPEGGVDMAYVTQTTLSVDDTREIVAALKSRFPSIHSPPMEDICYATTNRQEAVKGIAGACDRLIVVGSPTSSNSLRLVEVALRAGVADARLVEDAAAMDWAWLEDCRTLGLTAGASAPEALVDGLIAGLSKRFVVTIEEVSPARETVTFKLPRALAG
jgi:4-hydroxy-3-methylbut-2-en-1-yl diphosphate reductase